jgi:hypothetical protein
VLYFLLETGTESSFHLLLWQSQITLAVQVFQSAGTNMEDALQNVLTTAGAVFHFTQNFQKIQVIPNKKTVRVQVSIYCSNSGYSF